MINPVMKEILRSEYHRCRMSVEASELQVQVARDQLARSEERVTVARERLLAIEVFCTDYGIIL